MLSRARDAGGLEWRQNGQVFESHDSSWIPALENKQNSFGSASVRKNRDGLESIRSEGPSELSG